MRDLAEASRGQTGHAGQTSQTAPLSGGTAAVVRTRLSAAVPEMIEVIGRGVPEYARQAHPDYSQRLADAVTGAVAQFIAHIAQPGRSTLPITAEFRAIGGTAAREGRTLDALQDALRLGARVAWRCLCEADAGLNLRELSRVGEAIFAYLDELAAACAQGYAEARVQAAGEQQQRLLAMILSDPPPGPELLGAQARAAGWVLPAQVAVAALDEWRQQDAPVLPPDVLADWARPDPRLLVPDPDGPGRQVVVDRALRGWGATIGPAVPLSRAVLSLRWATDALALGRAGVIPAGRGPVRCDQHLSTLLILADEDLARTLRSRRLAPLARLRPGQRDRIAETLLAWLLLGENAAEVAQRIHVHPQTVRYRLRQITELFGDQLRDPDFRFELQLALRVRQLDGRRVAGRGNPPRSALKEHGTGRGRPAMSTPDRTEPVADGQL
jgi:PucR C-terminal helix-turn-helix domain